MKRLLSISIACLVMTTAATAEDWWENVSPSMRGRANITIAPSGRVLVEAPSSGKTVSPPPLFVVPPQRPYEKNITASTNIGALPTRVRRVFKGGNPRPPAEYDHPYEGSVSITRMDEDTIFSKCDSIGCSWRGTPCIIYIANADVLKIYEVDEYEVLRHEMGHCNGWPGTHPQH